MLVILMFFCCFVAYPAFAQTQATTSLTVPSVSNSIRASTNAAITNTSSNASSGASLKALLAEKRIVSTSANIPLFTPLPQHGRLFMTATQAFITLSKHDIQWLDYNGMAEIFAAKMPVFPLSLGSQGAFNHISFLGSSPRDVAIMINGRVTNDAALGAAYIEQLAPEMMEQAEIFIGSDAVILANNAAGAALNLQEIRHDSKDLYTRFWYSQSNEQYTAADVDLSHNIAPNLNLTIGARTQFGNRIYNNTGVSSWNARTILRWNVSPFVNVSLSYLLTQHRTALSGGVTSATVFDFSTSATVFNELRENTFRHDLALTGSAFLTRDSAIAASLTGYATLNERSLERASLQGTTLSGIRGGNVSARDTLLAESTTQTFSIGATGRIETRVRLFNALEAALTAGGTIGFSNLQSSIYWDETLRKSSLDSFPRSPRANTTTLQSELSAFGRLQFSLFDRINISGGARFTVLGTTAGLSLGAKISTLLINNIAPVTSSTLEFWGDVSLSPRFPTFSEQGMTSATLTPEQHFLVLAGLRLRDRSSKHDFSCDVLGGFRSIANPIETRQITVPYTFYAPKLSTPENPIVVNDGYRKNDPLLASVNRLSTMESSNGGVRTVLGASLMADWHVKNILFGGNFVFSGFAQVSVPLEGLGTAALPERVPLVYTGCTAQYEYVLGRSILRAGVRVRMMTAFQPMGFSPMGWNYFETNETQGLTGNGLDVVAAARVGNAYIRATYQNVLNVPMMNVALYPQYPSNVRVSVALTIAE